MSKKNRVINEVDCQPAGVIKDKKSLEATMNLLVDAIPMLGLLTGINRYLHNLYFEIEKIDINVHYYLRDGCITRMPLIAESDKWQKKNNNIRKLPDPVILVARTCRWLQYERSLRRKIEAGPFDVLHETAFTPARIKHKIPQVFTLHDLSLRHWRKMHPKERVWFADLFLEKRLREADFIITPSEFIKAELNETMQIPLTRIKAIPEAADSRFKILPEKGIADTRKKLHLPENYILFVGSLEPRKNIDSLVGALSATAVDIPLVLTGWSGWGKKAWLQRIVDAGLENRVITTGHISDQDLVAVYNGATALVYPSLYEGFGLPVIEAMASGCPVITSNLASLPEVAGEAAILLENPKNVDEIAAAIDCVVMDQSRQKKMRKLGLDRAQELTWERAASETLKVFSAVSGK